MAENREQKAAGQVNGGAARPVKTGVVVVSSGSDWYGRYGRRPEPRLRGEEERRDRQRTSRTLGR